MKKIYSFFVIFIALSLFGCAGLDLSKIDTKQVAKLVQDIIDQMEQNKPICPPPVTTPDPVIPSDPPHQAATVNLLEKDLFIGQQLNDKFFNSLEAYAKAGSTQLILFDFNLLPAAANKAGFPGRGNVIYYCFASTYADNPWNPVPEEPDTVILSNNRRNLYEWADRYILRVLKIAQNAPQTTIMIIFNDGEDRLGARLYPPVLKRLEVLGGRVTTGVIFPCPGC